jgi:hypothetical protein
VNHIAHFALPYGKGVMGPRHRQQQTRFRNSWQGISNAAIMRVTQVERTQHTLPILCLATFREPLVLKLDFLGSGNRSIQAR